uniref:CUE domain-containing protein n=1 Tax=Percolomonas cosmopolitus TaxID=63605 RepID=A0A7S1KKW7_9EUKA
MTPFLSFIQKNRDFFLEFFWHMRRPWDLGGLHSDQPQQDIVQLLIRVTSLAEQEDDQPQGARMPDSFTELTSSAVSLRYFHQDILNVSRSVMRVYWKLLMEFEVVPRDLDTVPLWTDLMSVYGFQNREIVRNFTLQWLIVEKNGEILVGKRKLNFTSFWNGICDSLQNVCQQVRENIALNSSNFNVHEVCLFLYDCSFSLRCMFEICPLFAWTTLENSENLPPFTVNDAKNNLPLLYWITVTYEFALEHMRMTTNAEERSTYDLIPFFLEQTRQNFQAVADVIMRELFTETLVAPAGNDSKGPMVQDILLERYFTPLLKKYPRDTLLERLKIFATDYLDGSLRGIDPPSQRDKFLERVNTAFSATIQMLSSATSAFIDSASQGNNTLREQLTGRSSLGLLIAEYDQYFNFIDSLEYRKSAGVQPGESADLIMDIVRAFKEAHQDRLNSHESVGEFYALRDAKLERLKKRYPKYGEIFLRTCLEYENGDVSSVEKMIESNNLPADLRGINKFQKGAFASTFGTEQDISSITSPSTASDFNSPVPWEQADIFADPADMHVVVGKKYKTPKMDKLDEGLRRRIAESIQYDDEYDDTYDAINEYSTVADGDEEESLQKMADINRGTTGEPGHGGGHPKHSKAVVHRNVDSQSNRGAQQHAQRGRGGRGGRSRRGGYTSHHNLQQDTVELGPLNDKKNKVSFHSKDSEEVSEDGASGGFTGRGRGRGGGRNKNARRRASKKRMTSLHTS